MKITLKKVERESLHTLNEKEIQQRLYGRYHRDGAAPVKGSSQNLLSPKFETNEPSKSFSFTNWLQNFMNYTQSLFSGFRQKFPWKFAAIITGLLVAVIILFQFLSVWFGKVETASTIPPKVKMALSNDVLKVPTGTRQSATKKIETVTPAPSEVFSAHLVTTNKMNEAQAPKKRYYTVQVCTYERESDAQQLTHELKSLNFPAFYLPLPSLQQRITHYVVFLGKEETYAGANTKLNEFRKTEDFQKFPDSFIRSL